MNDFTASRRTFLLGSMGLVTTQLAHAQAASLTAGQVIERIKAQVGIPWRAQTVDNIIAGTADTPVKGIATTMMATLDVVQRAAAAGKNMVITHESTFFSHQDRLDQIQQDPTYFHKLDFLKKNNMVVFHFHDHWHGNKPMDGIASGMIRELGWEKNNDPQNFRHVFFSERPAFQAGEGDANETENTHDARRRRSEFNGQARDCQLGELQLTTRDSVYFKTRSRRAGHRRNTRMGIGRICAGFDCCRTKESVDCAGSCRVRTGWHEILRRMDERFRQGSSG